MTFNDNQMLIISFEALNATITEFKNGRNQLEDTFERIGEDILVRRNADFYVSNYIVSNIAMIIEAVNSK